MKDTLFPPKQVTFDPVVIEKTVITEKTIGTDSDYYLYPSKTFTGAKPGYTFTLRDEGSGYYRDNV